MQAMHLVLAAVTLLQHPRKPSHDTRALVIPDLSAALVSGAAVADLQGLQGLASLQGMEGLAGLDGLAGLNDLAGLESLQDLSGLAELTAGGQWDVVPPVGWAQGDPADSLWRAARRAFNRGDYASATELYRTLIRTYPRSTYTGDSYYWQAFALFRNGDPGQARTLLDTQKTSFPRAATRRDADQLYAQIQSALAQQGDPDAAAWLHTHAAPSRSATAATGATATSASTSTVATASCPNADDDDDVRMQALNGLLQMDADNAVPILKRVLQKRDNCSAALRRKAVFLISQKHSDETENVLLDVVQHDPDAEVRGQAVFWLSQVKTDRAVVLLDSILRGTTDEELQGKALFALSQQRSPRAAAALRAFAERGDASTDARAKAIFWLGQVHSDDNAAYLRGLYAKLSDEDLKEKVIFSISQMGGTDNMRWLMDLALNEREDIEMRKKALFWVGQSHEGDLSQLTALYARTQNHEMKEQLIFVYSQRHEAAALDELIDIAKHETDHELRKKALFWIGQSHDPRAARVLEEIINQ